MAGSVDVPDTVLDSFLERKPEIYACEVAAGLVAVWNWIHMWIHRDIIWVIDNQSAMTAMIKGASPAQDVSSGGHHQHLL